MKRIPLNEKFHISGKILFEFVSDDLVEKYIGIVLGNGLEPSKQQTITIINDENIFLYDITKPWWGEEAS